MASGYIRSSDYDGNISSSSTAQSTSYREEMEIEKLKAGAIRKKGRGFEKSTMRCSEFEKIDPEDSNSGPQRSIEGWIVMCTGVHEEAHSDDIWDAFGAHGIVKNVHLNIDRRTGCVKGYALIEYDTFKEAQSAIVALDNTNFFEKTIKVSWVFVKPPPLSNIKGGNESLSFRGGYQNQRERIVDDRR